METVKKLYYIKYTFYDRSGQFRGLITQCAEGLALCTASSCVSGCRHRSPKINELNIISREPLKPTLDFAVSHMITILCKKVLL